ncbi:MAG: nucleotidyltransferase family protein [Planctomycetia bacterium]|nr:MAG: nucleotidyltransferase family protein [Planctomycetia bacterium]HQU32323.1 nucleotidyltransferase family protein [Candidatus Brocadia sapporoensis]
MSDLNLTPEEQFILTCLRTEFSGSGEADFSAFDFKSFDWDHVYKRSRQWRVAPLLYKAIKNRLVAPNSPLDLVVSIQSNEKGDSGGCCPLNPVVSAQPNEEKTVPLWSGRGEDFVGYQKPDISEYVTEQPPPLTPPTRGGEADIGKSVSTRGGEVDVCKSVSTRGGEVDVCKSVPTGGGEVDVGKLAPTGGGEVDVGKLVPTGDGEIDVGKSVQTGVGEVDVGKSVPTRGGEVDIGKLVPTGDGKADIGKLVSTRGVEVDVGELVPTGDGEVDVGKFAQTGSRHIPSPLMGEGKGGGELFPKHFLEKLKLEYIITNIANSKIYDTLSEIGNAFNKAGIPFILLKGSHLAQFVYQDIGLRPMGDIDILVKKEEMKEINKMLNKLGYKAEPLYKWQLHDNYAVNYYHKNKKSLQIHWELFSPSRFSQPLQPLPGEMVWKNAVPINLGNFCGYVLSNEVNLLYLCIHTAKHIRNGILSLRFYDIALFLQNNAVNETYFLELVKNSGLETLIYHMLQISKEYFGVDISRLIHLNFRYDPHYGNIDKYFSENKSESAFMRYCRILYTIPGLWGKLYTLFHYSFPSREYLICRYGVRKTYFFVHLNHILRRKG